MIYLLLGEDPQAKDQKILQIKSSLLKDGSDLFDFESLDSGHVTAAHFKKALLSLPVISSKRLILIRQANQLKPEAIKVLEAFAQEPSSHCELVLESILPLKEAFSSITAKAKVFNFGTKPEQNIFNMTKLMSAKKTTEALKMLNEFYDSGMYPLQMMGALVWYWGKEGKVLGAQKFQKGLEALEKADINIKRSRLLPEYAIEKLVVELVELQK